MDLKVLKYRSAVLDLLLLAFFSLVLLSFRLPIFSGGLYVNQPSYRFGTVPEGREINAVFHAQNLHPWPVILTNIQGSCGCTQPIADRPLPTEVAPFERISIRVSLDTSQETGSVKKLVTLTTEKGAFRTPVYLEGNVISRKDSN